MSDQHNNPAGIRPFTEDLPTQARLHGRQSAMRGMPRVAEPRLHPDQVAAFFEGYDEATAERNAQENKEEPTG